MSSEVDFEGIIIVSKSHNFSRIKELVADSVHQYTGRKQIRESEFKIGSSTSEMAGQIKGQSLKEGQRSITLPVYLHDA